MPFLNLPGIAVVHKEESTHNYHVAAETTDMLSACPHCNSDQMRRYGTKEQVFMDAPTHGKRVGIYLKRKRYQCKSCGKTPLEPLPQMDANRLCTNRLKTYIEQRSMGATFTSIADEVGLNEKTIRNIFRDHVSKLEAKYQFETPRWLGIDEVHLNRTMRCVLTNIEERTIVELLPSRTKKAVLDTFQRVRDKDRVEVFSMDMWRPYKDAVNIVFPDAQIVVDKFHVVRMANDALDKIRKANREHLTTKQSRALMNDRYVLLKRRHELSDSDQLKLSGWTANYPLLEEGYQMKEAFYDIWDSRSQSQAQEAYHAWLREITPEMKFYFNDLIKAVGNWHDDVFSYFDTRVTNAYTESLNNLIKVIHKVGRGYSFEALRAKILFSNGIHKVKKPKFERRSIRTRDSDMVAEHFIGYRAPMASASAPRLLGTDISTLARKLAEDGI